jgi:hypothetical protein
VESQLRELPGGDQGPAQPGYFGVVGKVEVMSIGVDVHDRLEKGRLDLSCLRLPHGVAAASDRDVDRAFERFEIGWVDVMTLHGAGHDGQPGVFGSLDALIAALGHGCHGRQLDDAWLNEKPNEGITLLVRWQLKDGVKVGEVLLLYGGKR